MNLYGLHPPGSTGGFMEYILFEFHFPIAGLQWHGREEGFMEYILYKFQSTVAGLQWHSREEGLWGRVQAWGWWALRDLLPKVHGVHTVRIPLPLYCRVTVTWLRRRCLRPFPSWRLRASPWPPAKSFSTSTAGEALACAQTWKLHRIINDRIENYGSYIYRLHLKDWRALLPPFTLWHTHRPPLYPIPIPIGAVCGCTRGCGGGRRARQSPLC